MRLCETLRLVLAPTLATKLRGDYRTGKRINMRKVIPYIASQFRKDKILLRRTKPSKRQYQVVVAIDDSESMADGHAGQLACEALATITKAMSKLEVTQLVFIVCPQHPKLLCLCCGGRNRLATLACSALASLCACCTRLTSPLVTTPVRVW